MKTINIVREQNIKVLKDYTDKLDIDYIYVPFEKEENIKVKLQESVLKGQLLYEDNNTKRYSSISGTVVKIDKHLIIIKNNYKELTTNTRARKLDDLSLESFEKYYSNNKIKSMLSNEINNLYINAIDDDPYTFNKYMYLKKDINEIANVINMLYRLFKINKITFVIKNSYNDLLDSYKVNINYYKVEDIYPIGHKYLIDKFLLKNSSDYLIDLQDIIDMIYEIKKNKVQTEKYITINGDIDDPKVYNVKKYCSLNEIYTNIKGKDVILNNSLCGRIVKNDQIIDDNTYSLIIRNKQENKEVECSKCGLCFNVCPMKINPLKKDDRCIACGLCNYVCPSKINIYERIQKHE